MGRATDIQRLLSRRDLLKTSGAAAALGAAGALGRSASPFAGGGRPAPARADEHRGRVPADAISIQLYTLRDLMGSDLEGTLAALAEIGYRKVEHAGFHGRSAEEFKTLLDAAGLRATAGHQSPPYPFDELEWRRTVDDAYTLGQHFIVEPLPNFALPGLFTDAYRLPSAVWGDYAETLNEAAEIADVYGIKVGYHNHNAEFRPLADDPSRTGFDVLVAETDPDLVHFELDIYWARDAEQDPVALLEAHPGRFRQLHVKDMDDGGDFADPGAGVIDFVRIFRAAAQQGITEEYIVERDDAGQDAIETARTGYQFLRDVRWGS